jgi:hypothetical protein
VIGKPTDSGLQSSRSRSLVSTHSGDPGVRSVQLVSQTVVMPPAVTEITTIGSCADDSDADAHIVASTAAAQSAGLSAPVRTCPPTVLSIAIMMSPFDRDRRSSNPVRL